MEDCECTACHQTYYVPNDGFEPPSHGMCWPCASNAVSTLQARIADLAKQVVDATAIEGCTALKLEKAQARIDRAITCLSGKGYTNLGFPIEVCFVCRRNLDTEPPTETCVGCRALTALTGSVGGQPHEEDCPDPYELQGVHVTCPEPEEDQ